MLMYIAWYGMERFIVEGLRTDSLMAGDIRVSQILSLVICIVSIVIQIAMIFIRKANPEKFVLYCNTDESKELLEQARKRRYDDDKDDGYETITDNDGDEDSPEDIKEEN